MTTYRTPGVYVEEISAFPPSVAQVATAVPAFIGYTETGSGKVERISTLLEYEALFGRPKPRTFKVTTQSIGEGSLLEMTDISLDDTDNSTDFIMYYCISHYFQNGGGSCYIISIGDYSATPDKKDFMDGLTKLEKEDEPTLILLTDAVNVLLSNDYYTVCQEVLEQCNKLGDRFAIFDVYEQEKATDVLRDKVDNMVGIGNDYLMYGAAYYPNLLTTLTHHYDEASTVKVNDGSEDKNLIEFKSNQTSLYNRIKSELNKQRIILPPSAAVAGVYASVDRDRGVWKAPANVSLSGTIGPILKITNEEQDSLNAPNDGSGKSINAIRAFAGKGTLVWGARTLAGDDNEWKYVSVRRLFNTIEESTRKASAFAVFEPNNATTWLKVKAMIESYLYGLWEQGALMGSTPEAAYFVNVGLGKTMTPDDVLNGRMIVEIGVAAVRPAEFIILRFTHKLPEA